MSFDATQRIRPARQTLEDAYDVPGKKFYYMSILVVKISKVCKTPINYI